MGIPPTPLDGGKPQVIPPVCLLSVGPSEPWQPRCVPGFGHRKQTLPGWLRVSLESGLGGIGHLVSEEQRSLGASREIRLLAWGWGKSWWIVSLRLECLCAAAVLGSWHCLTSASIGFGISAVLAPGRPTQFPR